CPRVCSYISSLVVFFLHCPDSLRDLHSFPTRRSSDLWCRLAPRSSTRSVPRPAWWCPARRRCWSCPGRPGSCRPCGRRRWPARRSEEHTSELQSREKIVCRLLLEKKKKKKNLFIEQWA